MEEIPRDRWQAFLKGFSQAHQGWLVSVEVVDPSAGRGMLVCNGPLAGISVDGSRLVIEVDTGKESHFTHAVEGPASMLLELDDRRIEKAVRIVSAAGSTEVRFRSALPPEMVDGIP